MPSCKECKNYFPIPEDDLSEGQQAKSNEWGDCVLRGRDARQEYWMSKPVMGEMDASQCSSFQKK